SERTDRVVHVSFSPGGAKFLIVDHRFAVVHDSRSRATLHKFDEAPGEVTGAGFSPDGRRVALATTQGAVLWDLESGKSLRPAGPARQVGAVAFSPDGQWVVAAGADNAAALWEVRSGGLLTLPLGHNGPVVTAQVGRK